MVGDIYQFRIALVDTLPEIWRRIQVPANYNFWDLHIAIQDAMGWLDYHLHEFRLEDKTTKEIKQVGIPDSEVRGDILLAGWEVPIADHLCHVGDVAMYSYDFGDGWEHQIALEAVLPADALVNYPVCLDGERACPPEDCGGIPGFELMLETLASGKAAERREINDWLKNHAKNYYPFVAHQFEPAKVVFDDPELRWANAFSR